MSNVWNKFLEVELWVKVLQIRLFGKQTLKQKLKIQDVLLGHALGFNSCGSKKEEMRLNKRRG